MNNSECSQPPFPVLPALPLGPHPDLQEKPPLPSLSLEEEENRFRRPNVVLRQSPTPQTLATYEAQFDVSKQNKQKVLNRKSEWIGRHVAGVPPQHSSSFPCPSPPPYTSHFSPPCRRFPAQQEFDDTDQFYIDPVFSKDDSFFYLGMSHEETNSREPFPSPWKPTFRSFKPVSDSRKRSCQVSPKTYSRVSHGTSFSAPTEPSSQPSVTERSFLPDIMEGLEPLSPYKETSSVDSSSPTLKFTSSPMVVQKIQHSPVSSSETRQMLDDIGVSESISSNCEETGSDYKHGSVPSLPNLAVGRPVYTSSLRAVKQDRRSLPLFGLKRPFSREKPSYKRKRRESESKSLAIGEQPPVPEAPDSQRGPAMEKQKDNTQLVSVFAKVKRSTETTFRAGGHSIKLAVLTKSVNTTNRTSNRRFLFRSVSRTRPPYPGNLTPSGLPIMAPIRREPFSSRKQSETIRNNVTKTLSSFSASDFTSENKNTKPLKVTPVVEAIFAQGGVEKVEETRFANLITETLDDTKEKRKAKEDSRDKLHKTKRTQSSKSVTLKESKRTKNPETSTMEITVQEPEKYIREETEAADTYFDCDHQAREAAVSLFSQELFKEVKGLLAAEEEEEASLAKTVHFKDSSSTSRVLVVKEPVLSSTSLEYLCENIEELVKSSQPEEDCFESVWNSWSPIVEESSSTPKKDHSSRLNNRSGKMFPVSNDTAALWESIDSELRSEALVCPDINSVVASVSPKQFPTPVTAPLLNEGNREQSSISVRRDPYGQCSENVPVRAQSHLGSRKSSIFPKKTTKRRNSISLAGLSHSLLSTLCSVGETETRRTRFVRSKQGLYSSTMTVVNDVEGLSSLDVSSGRKIEIKNATEEVLRLADSARVLYRPKIPAVGSDELGRLGDVRSETEMSQNSPGCEVPRVKPRAKPKIPILTTSQKDDDDESEISAKTALFESSSDVRAIGRNLPVGNKNGNNNVEKQTVLGEVLVELRTTVSTSLSDTDTVQNGTDQQDSCSRDSLGIKKQQEAGIESSVEDLASEHVACPERGNGKEVLICIAPEGSVMESASTHMEPTNATEAACCQDENVDLIVVASIANETRVTELCISPLVSTSQEGQDLVIGMQPEIGILTQVLDAPSAHPSLSDMLQPSENLDYDELVAGITDSVLKKTDCNANVELTSIKGKGKYSTLDSMNVHLKEASSSSSSIQDIEESSSNNEDSLHLEPHLLDHSYARKDAGRESNAKDSISELEPDATFSRWCDHTQRHLLLNWVDDFDHTGRKSSSVLREDIKEVEEVLVPTLSTVDYAIQVNDERTCTEFIVSEKKSEEEIGIFEETFRNEKCSTKGFADGEMNPKRQEDDQSNDEQQIENPVLASLIDRELKEIENFVMPFKEAFEEEKPCSKEDCSSIEPLVATCMEALGEQRIQDQEISRLLTEEGNPDLLSCATNLLESQPFVEAGNKSPSMEIDLSARNLSEETSPSTQEQNASIVPEFDKQEEPEELGSHIPSAMNERENPNEKEELSTTQLDVLNVLGAVGQEQTLLDAADNPRDEANADERDSKVKVPRLHTATTYFLGDLHKLQCGNTHVVTKRKKNLRWTASALRDRSVSPVTESSPSPCSQEMCSQRAQKPNRSSSPQKPLSLGIEKPIIPSPFVESKLTSTDLIHHSVTSTSTRAETNTIAIVVNTPIASPPSSFRWTDNGGFNLSDIEDGEEMLVAVSAGILPSPRPLSTFFTSNVHAVRRRAHSPQVASEKPERVTIVSSAVSANGLGFRSTEHSPFVLRSADGNWFRVTSLEPCRPVSGHKTQKSPIVTSRAPAPKCQREYTCSELDERGKITVSVKELLDLPGRLERDKNIVVIMRGLPGSGKSYAAKLIRAKELSMSGCAPRIISINDYFYFDTVANAPVVKMCSVYPKTWEYRHDAAKEKEYRLRLAERFKELIDNSFKRQLELVDDGASILILDDVNAKSEHYEELARFAYYRGYYVLVAECTASLETCEERSRAHQRSLKDIRGLALTWEKTPVRWPRLDLGWLLTTQIPFRQRRISEEAEIVG